MGSLHQLQPVHDSVSFRIAMSGGPDQNSLTQLSEAARPLDLAIDEATLVLSDDTVALIKTARHSAFWCLTPGTGSMGTSNPTDRMKTFRDQVKDAMEAAVKAIQRDARVRESV